MVPRVVQRPTLGISQLFGVQKLAKKHLKLLLCKSKSYSSATEGTPSIVNSGGIGGLSWITQAAGRSICAKLWAFG